jgi:AcrR family transcriptional regulator
MARPRKASDDEIFEAAYRLMGRLGPAQWTLADVAAEVGLTAGALVQRFGSKRSLQVQLIAKFADALPAMYAELRHRHQSPLAAVRAYAEQVACLAESPGMLAHHLDYLKLDLTDPDMHVHFRRQAEVAQRFVREALADAVAQGELPEETNVVTLARQVETVITGSLFTWATYREGSSADWIRRDLDLALGVRRSRPMRKPRRRR